MKKKIKVTIDPVIEQRDIHIPLNMRIRDIVCLSMINSEIRFRVRVESDSDGEIPEKLTLSHIKLMPVNKEGLEETVGIELVVKNIHRGVYTLTDSFNHIFPYADAFWLQAEVNDIEGFDIETNQIVPNGKEGQGWPRNQSGEIKKRKWTNYVIALDRFSFEQKKLNSRLLVLTWVLVALGLIQLFGIFYELLY